jgi:hypothetical protein
VTPTHGKKWQLLQQLTMMLMMASASPLTVAIGGGR